MQVLCPHSLRPRCMLIARHPLLLLIPVHPQLVVASMSTHCLFSVYPTLHYMYAASVRSEVPLWFSLFLVMFLFLSLSVTQRRGGGWHWTTESWQLVDTCTQLLGVTQDRLGCSVCLAVHSHPSASHCEWCGNRDTYLVSMAPA